MTEIKLTKRYPNSRTEDITDAYMRGWNDALDAVQNGKFHIADTPQTKHTCDTCRWSDEGSGGKCLFCCDKNDKWELRTDCGWK